MPVSYRWFPEQESIILFEISGDWTWDDFHEAQTGYFPMIQSVTKRVDFIMDFSNASNKVPTGGFANIASLTKRGDAHPQWKLSVMVMPNPIYRTIMQTFARLYPRFGKRFRIVKTIDEALAALAADRMAHQSTQEKS